MPSTTSQPRSASKQRRFSAWPEVARNTSVDTSAVQAITGLNTSVQELKQQVADLIALGGDPAAIQAAIDAFADQMAQSTDALAAAIPANTEPPTP
jgi:hypothetical protein